MPPSDEDATRPRRALEAWLVGVVLGAGGLLFGSGLADDVVTFIPWGWWTGAAVVFFATSAAAATVASATRADALEIGAVLAWAHLPLVLAQGAAWLVAPGPPRAGAKLCSCVGEHIFLHQQDFLFLLSECAAITCLAVGAYGLAARHGSASRRTLVAGLIVAGALGGGLLEGWLGATVGGLLALAAGVFVFTVEAQRGSRPVTATGARVLSVLCLSLGCAAIASRVAFDPRQHLPPAELAALAEGVAATYRSLLIALGGSGVMLVAALASGRRAWPAPAPGLVILATAGLLLGGAGRLHSERLQTFHTYWSHLEDHRLRDP